MGKEVAQAKPSFVPVAEATPVFTALSSSRKESSGSIIIGPEGGLPMAQLSGLVQQLQLRRKLIISYFTEKEVDVIIEAGATAVGLGTHRLQVKTAAIALLATVMLWLRKGFSGVPLPEAQRQSMSSFLRDTLHHVEAYTYRYELEQVALMTNQLENLVESIKSKVRSLKKKTTPNSKKKPYVMMDKSASVKVEIRSRKARKLIDKTLQVADRPGKRTIS
ncbi:hypothetical protein RHSIM_Rhsim05G0092200 [Rhododendron simsii]|uniref:Ribosomal RNA small subunit methyltransferase E methyltransferase domain-containing protein n=2 Tax=Rhododendron TaxID=4346 RepID=A0A834LQ18_RHOSS|nr:hypothetical protein RHSIM_Rhsim05G0092200 [Rhododendron simsii]